MVKAKDLVKEQQERKKQKEKTFKKILKIVEKKLVIANTGDNSSIWFELSFTSFQMRCLEYGYARCQ